MLNSSGTGLILHILVIIVKLTDDAYEALLQGNFSDRIQEQRSYREDTDLARAGTGPGSILADPTQKGGICTGHNFGPTLRHHLPATVKTHDPTGCTYPTVANERRKDLTGRTLGWLQHGQTQQPSGRSSTERQGCVRHSVCTALWH